MKPKELKALGLKINKVCELVNLDIPKPPSLRELETRCEILNEKINKILEWIKAKDAEAIKPVAPKEKPKITKEQIEILDLELMGRPTLGMEIKNHFKIDHLSELPPEQFLNVMSHIKKLISNEKYMTPAHLSPLD